MNFTGVKWQNVPSQSSYISGLAKIYKNFYMQINQHKDRQFDVQSLSYIKPIPIIFMINIYMFVIQFTTDLSYISEISETLCLGHGFDIQGSVSSGLSLKNCSYPSLRHGLSFHHQQFPSLSFGLETETDFLEPQSQSRKMRLTFKRILY